MSYFAYKHTLITSFLLATILVAAQKKFDPTFTPITFDLNGKRLSGYKSTFDFSRQEVRKGWWRYARQFGKPLDMRSFYQVRIPSETTDGNIDLLIFTQVGSKEKQGVMFKIGMEHQKYRAQLEKLLIDFKHDFYLRHYTARLKTLEREAGRLGKRYLSAESASEKTALLDSMLLKQEETKQLKESIKTMGQFIGAMPH